MVLGLVLTILTLPFTFFGLLTSTTSVLIGLVYPTLESFAAIESKESADDIQWLSYWVVVTTLLVLEKLAWPILYWVPLYSLLRVAGLAWLALPQFQGAKLAYKAVRPFLFVALEKSKEIPALEPYLRSYQRAFSSKDFDALKKEAIKVVETFETAKLQAAAPPEEAEPADTYQPLKTHAQ